MSARRTGGSSVDMSTARRRQLRWPPIITRAAEIVRSYDTPVTLRQIFYRLVAEQLIPNDTNAYKVLSSPSAEARRAGTFPDLTDRGRSIHGGPGVDMSPREWLEWVARDYRRQVDEGQPSAVFLASEKATMVEQFTAWTAEYGTRVVAVSGYSSQSYVDEVARSAAGLRSTGRRTVLLYLGDHDPSGEDIDRDFIERTGDVWDERRRLALTPALINRHALPQAPGKPTDSRAAGFIARHGELVQVELEALPPDVLRALVIDAVSSYWNDGVGADVRARESDERAHLRAFVDTYREP